MAYPTVVASPGITMADPDPTGAVPASAGFSPIGILKSTKAESRRRRSIRGLTRKYAHIVNFGRKTVFDPDLPDWDEGYPATRSYSGSTHTPTVKMVDDLEEARFKDVRQPNLISSKVRNNLHAPIIDVDFPVHVIPSQTPGHFHLAFDKVMEEAEYFAFLEALEEFGIIEEGYKEMSIKRGASLVRVVDDLDIAEQTQADLYMGTNPTEEIGLSEPW